MATTEQPQNGTATHPPESPSADAQLLTTDTDATANESTQEIETVTETGTDTATAAVTPPEQRWPGWPGDCVFRLIVPVGKVGGIIGRKGDLIKKLCDETKARVRVLDADLGIPDRIVSDFGLNFDRNSSNFFSRVFTF